MKTAKTDEKLQEMVPLRNIGKSIIFGHHPDEFNEDGSPKKYAFAPETSGAFHPDEAEKLKRLYPKTIMDIGDVQKLLYVPKSEEETNALAASVVPVISVEEAEAQKQQALDEMRATVDARFESAVDEAVARVLAARDKEEAKKADAAKKAEEAELQKQLEAEEKAAKEKKAAEDKAAKAAK